jgi:hypothetical protein
MPSSHVNRPLKKSRKWIPSGLKCLRENFCRPYGVCVVADIRITERAIVPDFTVAMAVAA